LFKFPRLRKSQCATTASRISTASGTSPDCLEEQWIKAREAKPARTRFFEHIPTITAYLVFPSWETLMTTLINSKPPPEIEKQMGL
jgi:hypothetical protein